MRRAPRHSAGLEMLKVAGSDPKFLQDLLVSRFSLTRRGAKAVIDGRNVWVNHKCVWIARYTLNAGDVVEIPSAVVRAACASSLVPRGSCLVPRASCIVRGDGKHEERGTGHEARGVKREARNEKHIRVLWQNENFLVCDKPAGLVSCDDMRSVEALLREQEHMPTLEAVHRLDRDTTGCLMFAKSHAALEAAIEVFRTHKVAKTYHAITVGKFKYAHTRIDEPLDGENAVSDVSREKAGDDASFLRIRIETGRTNQIRRHLSSVRAPIVGDRVFGLKSVRDPRLMQVPRQMLHASTLELPDPVAKGERIRVHSPLPADFRATLRLFGMGK